MVDYGAEMQIEDSMRKYIEIFAPHYMGEVVSVVSENSRFAYYTSTQTALKIFRNQELWLRNATVMNDFSEIRYGLNLTREVFSGEVGRKFRGALQALFPNIIERAEELYSGWSLDWQYETYIACISKHDPSEDKHGRLSMWRAYGDVALVVNNTPLLQVTDDLGAYSIPVSYLDSVLLSERLSAVADNILDEREYLLGIGEDGTLGCLQQMLFTIAIGTKHPGFHEEKEWRVFFRPNDTDKRVLQKRIEVIGNTPQEIWTLPLKHDPENGLHNADIPSLLDRVIIGPTEYSYVSIMALKSELEIAGVEDAGSKVIASDIPLRRG